MAGLLRFFDWLVTYGQTELGDVEVDLAELERLVEFVAVAVVAYIVSSGLRDS